MQQQQEIQWKRNNFLTFYAKMKIRVGAHGGGDPVDIMAGDEFEYDGSVLRYAGQEFPQPHVRSMIREGWAVMDPNSTEESVPSPKKAARDVAVSQSKTTDLSRVQRHSRKVMDQDSLDEETVLEVSDRAAVRDPRTGKGHLTERHNKRAASTAGTFRGFEVTQSDIDEQDYTPLGKVKSPNKLKVDVLNNPGAARQIEARSREDGYGTFHGPRRQSVPQVVEREGVTIRTSVGSVDRTVRSGDGQDGDVIGKVRHSGPKKRTSEGVSIEDTSGPRVGNGSSAKQAHQQKPQAKPQQKPQAKPKAAPKLPASASPKLKMAVRIFPDFPVDWNYFGKVEDKIARIRSLGADPRLLDAVYSTDSGAVQKALEKEFRAHFA